MAGVNHFFTIFLPAAVLIAILIPLGNGVSAMKTFRFAAAAAVAALVSSEAMAAVVTFDFTGNGGTSSSVSETEGDLTVTARGKTIWDSVFFGRKMDDARLGRYSGGLGVMSSLDGSHQVDGGIFQDELIEFSFDSSVQLRAVNFSLVDRNDGFRWGYDSDNDGSFGLDDWLSGGHDIPGKKIFVDFGDISSSVFVIGAFGWNDQWKLESMTVEYDPAVVPLPATALLLGAALGGFGMVARRKKSA